jgi:hypothetical protein
VRDDGGSVRAVAVIVVAVACQSGAPPSPEIQIVGETTKLRVGEPAPATSPFFDGKRVAIRAARGEVVALQLLYRGDRPVKMVVPGVGARLWAIGALRVRRPSTALFGPSRGPGDYPDRLRAIEPMTPVAGPVLVEVPVARDAAPGVVRGALTIGDRELPVELRIEAVTLPAALGTPRVWGYYDAREVRGGRDAERACASMLRAHGVMATPELTPESWDDRKAAVDGSPFVPVLLPANHDDAVGGAIAAWTARLAGTGKVAFAIPIDEPRYEDDKRRVRALADRVRAAGGGRGRFLYAVTDAPHPIYGDAIDLYISPRAVTLATAESGWWTYNGTPPEAGAMVLDTYGTALRTWGWIGWRWRVPIWYVWDVLYWHDRHNRRKRGEDPMGGPPAPRDGDAVTFDDGDDRGNLDGVLALPASDPALGCTPTLRLLALRRGLQDRLLLDALEACAGRDAADAIARSLVPIALGDAKPGSAPSWPWDEAAWEAGRQRIFDALAACTP